MNKNRQLSVLLAILLVTSTALGWSQATAPVTTKALSATERQLVESINLATIKETVNALAADEMQGRGTAQPGGDKAAAYLANRFAKLGLKPSTIRKMIMQRRIEVFRPTPRSVRISERTIEAILAKGFRPAISA